MESSRLFARAL